MGMWWMGKRFWKRREGFWSINWMVWWIWCCWRRILDPSTNNFESIGITV
jgi:hypothetical protein